MTENNNYNDHEVIKMVCDICKGLDMIYQETIVFSTGRVADVYKCKKCGFIKRIYRNI